MDAQKLEVVGMNESGTGDAKKVFYQRLGSATPDKGGQGWIVYLNALPLNGRLWLRPIREREDR